MSLWTMLALAVLLSENGQRESETQALQQEIAHLRAGLPAEEQALAAAVAAREGIALPDAAVPASPGSLLPAAPEAPTAQSARSSETAALEEKLGDLSRFVMPVFLLLFVLTGLRMVLRG